MHRQADAEAHTVRSFVTLYDQRTDLSSRGSARKHVLLPSTVLLAALLLVVVAARASLLVGGLVHTVLAVVAGDLALVHNGKLLRGQDVALVLEVTLGEDKVDLLERATRCLRVQEVNDGKEAGVKNSEEEVGVSTDAGDQDWGYHDNELHLLAKAQSQRLGTLTKFQSQLEMVEVALAFARVLMGLISAGYNQGRGSQVAPKKAM